MSYQNMIDALALKMPKKIPRTEYSANTHWSLVSKVTGIPVTYQSEPSIQAFAMCAAHPDQVNMTGIYVTMISGLLAVFGWEMLLEGMGEDPDAFGGVANRYADWILAICPSFPVL